MQNVHTSVTLNMKIFYDLLINRQFKYLSEVDESNVFSGKKNIIRGTSSAKSPNKISHLNHAK